MNLYYCSRICFLQEPETKDTSLDCGGPYAIFYRLKLNGYSSAEETLTGREIFKKRILGKSESV